MRKTCSPKAHQRSTMERPGRSGGGMANPARHERLINTVAPKTHFQAERLAFIFLRFRCSFFYAFKCSVTPWDVGTARMLAQLGFEALATTSAGYAFSVGQRDGTIGRDETMAHVSAIASATDLPVTADLENGFGDAPEIVAETIKLAAEAGLGGGSIEDASGRVNCTLLESGASASAARFLAPLSAPFFAPRARCESMALLHSRRRR